MSKFLVGLLISGLIASEAVAVDCRFGRAPYFLHHARFNYSEYRRSMAGIRAYPVAVLWNTPGNNRRNLELELENPAVCAFMVVLLNENCVKWNRCGSYETLAGMNLATFQRRVRAGDRRLRIKIQAEAARAAAWLRPRVRAGMPKLINPLLETGLSRSEWSTVAGWIRPFFPDWEFIWNPIGPYPGKPQPPAVFSEGHGESPGFVSRACIANVDGGRVTDWPAYFGKYSYCRYVFGWGPNDNCNVWGGAFVDPRSRSCRTTSDFKSIADGIRAVLRGKT